MKFKQLQKLQANTEHEKLDEFDPISNRQLKLADKQEIVHHDLLLSLLKDDGVKTKIIRKYLPFSMWVNVSSDDGFYINFDKKIQESEVPYTRRFLV